MPVVIAGEEQLRCPRRPIFEEPGLWSELLEGFADYDANRLPEDGGVLSQPHVFMESMRTMMSARNEAERIERKIREDREDRGRTNS